MNHALLRTPCLATGLLLLAAPSGFAQRDIRAEPVRFEPGATSAVVENSIAGYDIVDYVLGAREGQYMNISMATDNIANYFNILAPGEDEVAMFNGSMSENQYEGRLPESGDYRIRVYMMRSAARRGEVANYRLEMIIADADDEPAGGDAIVPGTDYHATGDIPCSMAAGPPSGLCPFGVRREGEGSGIITVTKPDGRSRSIFFEDGRATGYDMSQADPGEFSVRREADMTIVHIGEERYEIPDAVIWGG